MSWLGWSRIFGWPRDTPSFPSGPIKPFEEKSDTALLQIIAAALVDPDTGLPRTLLTSSSGGGGGGDASAANQVTEIARLTSILAQLDVALSTRASQTTVASILTELGDLASEANLTGFRNANHNDLLDILTKISADPATEATLADILAKLFDTIAITGALTDAELRASPIGVSLYDSAGNGLLSQGVGPFAGSLNVNVVNAVAVFIGAGASTIGKTADDVAGASEVGVPAMAIRKATPSNLSNADGDYEMLQMAAGRLWVSAKIPDGDNVTVGAKSDPKSTATDATAITVMAVLKQISFSIQAAAASLAGTLTIAAHAVTNAGIFAVQATIAAGAATIGKAEDAASADADVGVPAMAVRKATPANTSGTDGDYEMLQVSAGRLWVSAVLSAGAAIIGKFGIDQTTPGTTNAVQLTGSQLTLGSSTETGDGSVAAGKKYAEFIFSPDFIGTLNGQTYNGTVDASEDFEAPAGYTLASIPYTIATGSIRIHSF